MIKSINNLKKQEKDNFNIPKSIQQVIPIQRIWTDGIFLVGKNKYSQTFKFSDINYAVASKEAKNYYNIKVYEYKNLKEGKITIGPFDIEVIYTKGHTNDSVTYYFKEEKIMFTGDFIFKNSIGRTDLGGNTKDMIESINKIKHYDDSIIIYPGHGEYTTLSSEKENNEFFNTLH